MKFFILMFAIVVAASSVSSSNSSGRSTSGGGSSSPSNFSDSIIEGSGFKQMGNESSEISSRSGGRTSYEDYYCSRCASDKIWQYEGDEFPGYEIQFLHQRARISLSNQDMSGNCVKLIHATFPLIDDGKVHDDMLHASIDEYDAKECKIDTACKFLGEIGKGWGFPGMRLFKDVAIVKDINGRLHICDL